MDEQWMQSILTQDQFKEIDLVAYDLLLHPEKYATLKHLHYFVLARKISGLNRQIIFSPDSIENLVDIMPGLHSIEIKPIKKPELIEVIGEIRPFVYWFGNMNYFIECYPEAIEH